MSSNDKIIWQHLKSKGLTDAGIAGIMGNLYAESGLKPTNLQNTFEKKLKYTDETYTKAVDSGIYKNFINDSAGYGLAQWTYWSRKKALLNFCKAKNKSVGDLLTQLDFLLSELTTGYIDLLNFLKTTSSVEQASNRFLLEFERPADKSKTVQDKRISYAYKYYNLYTNQKGGEIMSNSSLISYTRISPNRTSPRNHIIDTITIHCVVGQLSLQSLGSIFASTSRKASCNYGISPDGKIGMYVEEKDRSWCSSSASNDHRAITIEVASDTFHPYAVTDAAYAALIRLLVDICQRNPAIKRLKWKGDKTLIGKIDKQNMTVHRWFANKACPGDYLYNKHFEIAEKVNAELDLLENSIPNAPKGNKPSFIPIEQEEEEMTQEQFNSMMDNWIAEQAKKGPSAWSEQYRVWAEKNNLISGNESGEKMYKKPLTREEFITVLYRALHRNIID